MSAGFTSIFVDDSMVFMHALQTYSLSYDVHAPL